MGVFENFMKIVTTFFQGTFRIQFTILIIIRAVLTNQSREVIGKNRDFPLKSHLGHCNDLKFQDSSMLCSRGMEILDLVTVHGFAWKKSHKFCHKREKGQNSRFFALQILWTKILSKLLPKYNLKSNSFTPPPAIFNFTSLFEEKRSFQLNSIKKKSHILMKSTFLQ